MTKFERAIAKLQSMPVERRELMLDAILGSGNEPEFTLTDEQLADLDLSIEEADAGIFVSDEEMATLWKSFGL